MSRSSTTEDPVSLDVRPVGMWATPFIVWNGFCLFVIISSFGSLPEEAQELVFIYYQPLVPLFAMLWMWGVNVAYFESAGIKYEALFSPEEQRYLLKGVHLHELAAAGTSAVATSVAIFVLAIDRKNYSLAELMPGCLYFALLVILLLPPGILHGQSRYFFCLTLRRIFFPIQAVTFSDFILADIMTSIAKALADVQRAVCLMFSGPVLFNLPGMASSEAHHGLKTCSRGSLSVNAVLALPYLFRLCQCVIVYISTRETSNLFNAIKYATVFPVVGLSMLKYHVSHEAWASFWWYMWVLASIVNTMYSYYWDIEMDWDISWFSVETSWCWLPTGWPNLKADLLYNPRWLYLWAMGSDFFGRIAWIYKLSSHLKHWKVATFSVALVEVFRRFQWVFLRVECGLRKLPSHRWLESDGLLDMHFK